MRSRAAGIVRRAGSTGWGWLVVFCVLAIAAPSAAAAQVPDTLPADTLPADTLPGEVVEIPIPPETMARDTLPSDTVPQDSAVPVPPFPRYPGPPASGWAFARWEWNRAELLRYHSLSLLQLIERLPGMNAFRAGDFGQPAGVTALGLGGARVRVYLDGFELDPLGYTTSDLQQVALGDLEAVRVSRGLDGIRIDLTPLRLPDPRALSAVEAATGPYDTKLLRGLLMRGIGSRSTLLAAFDQSTTRGVGFSQAFTYRSARVAYSYALGATTALQVDYRADFAESAVEAVPIEAGKRTLILRGRSELAPGLLVDGMLGRITRRPEAADPLDAELSAWQGAVRAGFDLGRLWLEGSARGRSNADQGAEPGLELEARGVLSAFRGLSAEGSVRSATLHGVSALQGSGTVRAGPVGGLSVFGTLSFGQEALALVRDTTVELPGEEEGEIIERVEPRFSAISAGSGAVRVGTEWLAGSTMLGVAGIALPDGEVVPFGLTAVDRGFAAVEVASARGVEAFVSLPVPGAREYLRVEGSFSHWTETGDRPYLPEQSARVALQAQGLFYGGQLEPSLRVEGVHHGPALVPGLDATGFDSRSLAYSQGNLQLQIRILDVRAFFIFDNITDQRTLADLPGRPLPGGRFYYGLRWTFRN